MKEMDKATIEQEIRTAATTAIDSMALFKTTQPERYNQLTKQLGILADLACTYLLKISDVEIKLMSINDAKTFMRHWFRMDDRSDTDKKLVPLMIKYLGVK
jgi:hypothetical protein